MATLEEQLAYATITISRNILSNDFFTKIALTINILFLNLWDTTYKMLCYMKTKKILPQRRLLTVSI